MHFQNFFISQ